MAYEKDDGHQQQKMNESAGYIQHQETASPESQEQ
jgi:hypothetical protein